MNILNRPDLMDRLAAAYALGTLRGGARRRFEALARQSPTLRVTAQVWQERFMSMTELQQSEAPGPNVWKKIENLVAAEARPVAAAPAAPLATLARKAESFWRLMTMGAGAVALGVLAVTVSLRMQLEDQRTELAQVQTRGQTLARQNEQLLAQAQRQPDVRYVSVLMDDKSAPAMLATFDPKHGTLTLKRIGSYQEGPEKSLQLWAIPASGAPRSLGVLGEQPVLRLAAQEQVVGQSPALAISLEPKGGVPGEGGPTGPVLWKGAVLQTPI